MKICLEKNEKKSLTLIDESNVQIDLKKGSSLDLVLFFFDIKTPVKLNGQVLQNASLKLVVGDFSKKAVDMKGEIILKEENSKADLLVRSISKSNDIKNIDISLIQSAKNTYGYSDSFGISKGKSLLKFCGIDHIKHGASGSFASLNYKVVVFDEDAKGIANPVLKIDENDVKASHGAIVGRLNEDELFYLNSRGLSEIEAKKLIADGYFSKLTNFGDDIIKAKINESIQEIFNA